VGDDLGGDAASDLQLANRPPRCREGSFHAGLQTTNSSSYLGEEWCLLLVASVARKAEQLVEGLLGPHQVLSTLVKKRVFDRPSCKRGYSRVFKGLPDSHEIGFVVLETCGGRFAVVEKCV